MSNIQGGKVEIHGEQDDGYLTKSPAETAQGHRQGSGSRPLSQVKQDNDGRIVLLAGTAAIELENLCNESTRGADVNCQRAGCCWRSQKRMQLL